MTELDKFLEAAIEMARAAGEIQMRYFRAPMLESETKQNSFDVVTEADMESERFIKAYISEHFPEHGIISEESGAEHSSRDWRWVVDPLDGTTNFNNGLPVFSVSIALEFKGEAMIGVVYAPYLRELFHSVKGRGAFLNGKEIRCSSRMELNQAVVATGMPYDRADNPDNNLAEIERVVCNVRGTRRLGSAAIDLCYTAAGFYDAYWELNLKRWDVAAGILIAKESGAVVESIRKDRNCSILVCAPSLLDQFRPLICPDKV
ncbi:MAG: inositol monophosphatase [Muribaculaceae bacterium]|nr:inositol monophosphatase [Muribaculaceae bacterium]